MSIWTDQDYDEVKHLTRISFRWGVASGFVLGGAITFTTIVILAVYLGY